MRACRPVWITFDQCEVCSEETERTGRVHFCYGECQMVDAERDFREPKSDGRVQSPMIGARVHRRGRIVMSEMGRWDSESNWQSSPREQVR